MNSVYMIMIILLYYWQLNIYVTETKEDLIVGNMWNFFLRKIFSSSFALTGLSWMRFSLGHGHRKVGEYQLIPKKFTLV